MLHKNAAAECIFVVETKTFCTHFALISANLNYFLHTFATLDSDAHTLVVQELQQNCAQYHLRMEFLGEKVARKGRGARAEKLLCGTKSLGSGL